MIGNPGENPTATDDENSMLLGKSDQVRSDNEEEGHTVILITHERTTAEHAERIIHILDGRIDKVEKIIEYKP